MRNLLARILAILMVLSICSFASAAEKPITVTVFRGDPGDQPTSNNKIYKLIEEEFGIKFEIEFLAGDLDETPGTKLIGEDYPTSRICCPSWSMRTANCSSSPTTASPTTIRSRWLATALLSSSRSRFWLGTTTPRSRPWTSTLT